MNCSWLAADVGGAKLRREHVPLFPERRFARPPVGGDGLEVLVAFGEALPHVAEFFARAADIFLGIAQLARERVTPVGVAAHRALQVLDALAHRLEFLLGIGGRSGGGRQHHEHAQKDCAKNRPDEFKPMI